MRLNSCRKRSIHRQGRQIGAMELGVDAGVVKPDHLLQLLRGVDGVDGDRLPRNELLVDLVGACPEGCMVERRPRDVGLPVEAAAASMLILAPLQPTRSNPRLQLRVEHEGVEVLLGVVREGLDAAGHGGEPGGADGGEAADEEEDAALVLDGLGVRVQAPSFVPRLDDVAVLRGRDALHVVGRFPSLLHRAKDRVRMKEGKVRREGV